MALLAQAFRPGTAIAADAVWPLDGEITGSQPPFVFDVVHGVAEIEVARAPETLTDGTNAGRFISTVYTVSPDLSPGTLPNVPGSVVGFAAWNSPLRLLGSRSYYWHARLLDRGTDPGAADDVQHDWTPVRRIDVGDEVAILEGWLVRALSLRPTSRCRTRFRLRGRIVWSDNNHQPSVRYSVGVQVGGEVIGRVRGRFTSYARQRFEGVICSRRRVAGQLATVSAAIRDMARFGDPEDISRGPDRQLRIPAGRPTPGQTDAVTGGPPVVAIPSQPAAADG